MLPGPARPDPGAQPEPFASAPGTVPTNSTMRLLLPILLASASLPGCALVVDKTPEQGLGNVHFADEAALGPYSALVMAGEFVFVSGKIGTRGLGFETEVNTAIDAVQSELERVGLGLRDVVSATVYLTDMQRYAELNAIYAARFPAPYPARACVAVAALPAGAQVEIQVVARRP